MGREFELKYRASQPQLSAIEAAYPGFSPITMETAYYDTPKGDFSRLRWTLRRRYENGKAVCTMKTPEENGVRGEWEIACDSIAKAIPELCKLGAPKELGTLTAGGLVLSCAARFTRLAAVVEANGCTVEIALDRGVLMGAEKELPFAEVEVELKEGSEEAAAAFAGNLASRFGLTPEPKSKVQRAMELVHL